MKIQHKNSKDIFTLNTLRGTSPQLKGQSKLELRVFI